MHLAGCSHRTIAAQAAGLGRATFKRWMDRGKKERSGRFHAFRAAILEAEKRAEMRMAALLSQHASSDPRSAQWMLTHRFPKRWAEKQKVELSGGVDVGLSVDETVTALADKLARVAAGFAKNSSDSKPDED